MNIHSIVFLIKASRRLDQTLRIIVRAEKVDKQQTIILEADS